MFKSKTFSTYIFYHTIPTFKVNLVIGESILRLISFTESRNTRACSPRKRKLIMERMERLDSILPSFKLMVRWNGVYCLQTDLCLA
uniref:Uncharacterized protein n=1 Tax=Megaselia scalaris TaxID=36166 RepID=T1GYQ7_MEGSC